MRTKLFLIALVVALSASLTIAQDNGEDVIKKALEGRQVLMKIDLPAVSTGIPMTFDDTNVSFDEASYKKLMKDYGVGIAKDSRARITSARVTPRGIEIDLNGGGMPEHDWMVAGLKISPPVPAEKSYREMELERMINNEPNSTLANYWRNELESERAARAAQDLRNQEAYQRVVNLRTEYIEKNRKVWGSMLVIAVHSRGPNVKMKDMVKSLGKYVEFLPRDTAGQ